MKINRYFPLFVQILVVLLTLFFSAPIYALNNAPVMVPGGPFSIGEVSAAGTLVGTVSANDPDGDFPLDYSIVTGNAAGYFDIGATTGEITVTAAGSAGLDYETVPSYTLGIRAFDGVDYSMVINYTVNLIDLNVVSVADAYSVNEGEVLNIAAPGVLANDTDDDGDTLTAVLVAGTANGTVTLNPDGSFTYTAEANWNGTDSFTYMANDGMFNSSPATVTITVSGNFTIPTLSEWGMIVMSILLGITAVVYIRRQRMEL